jgi:hypothetical protein
MIVESNRNTKLLKGNKMKKATYALILLLAMVATACGSASNGTNPASRSQDGSSPAAGELPATTQLILGTIKLEGTAQAVTAKQAADLLPLWQTMKVLSTSDTAAQQEKDALIAQIQETMTTEQMQAIKDMNLSRADMASLMQEQGMAAGNGPAGGQNNNSQNRDSSNNGRRSSGGGGGFFPGGGMPPDGGRPGGGFGGQGQNLSKEQIATAQAARQANTNSIPPMLINAVIEYLQKKAGA